MKDADGIFIDTGAFLAMLIPSDQFTNVAVQGWNRLGKLDIHLFSSEPVLVETLNLLIRQQNAAISAEWLKAALESDEIRWLQPSKDDYRHARELILKFSDQRISMTDALSFALMRRHKISQAFTFDRHFAIAGFDLWQSGG